MRGTGQQRFVHGIAVGMLGTLTAAGTIAWVGGIGQVTPNLQAALWIEWIHRNLGLSLPLFIALLLLFGASLARLRRALASQAPVETIAKHEHLLDTWTHLFFGVGVIWTAIGMRGALIYALGEPGEALALGARAILERMVDGGMLVALSTTIVGGIGGYLLRVVKVLSIETDLRRYYDQQADTQAGATLTVLRSIDARLRQLADAAPTKPETRDA